MYPALPRWSTANSGAVPATTGRPSPPSRTSQAHMESPPVDGQLPNAHKPTALPHPAQTKEVSRSGQIFVNHNVAPVTAAGPAASSSPLPRGGYGGVSAPAHAAKRRGVMRGTTVTNAVAARHDMEAPPVSLGVEGVQTGEEVLVDAAAARRRSLQGNNTTGGACPNPQEHAQVAQLKRQLDKLNATVKSFTAANRREKQERDALTAQWEVQLAECEARLRAAHAQYRSRESVVTQHTSQMVHSATAEAQRAQRALQAATEARAADAKRYEEEMALLRRQLASSDASAAAQTAADQLAAEHQRENERLCAELEALQQSSAAKQLELETSLADTQSLLHKTNEELQECRQIQQQCNYLVQQCRLFILQVCQPGFSVVKGPSLEPVDKDRPEPSGFVLIPLTVLLHGYTLLPEGDRQDVIDHYDNEAKTL